jgi:putative tricarboxylic transport membrane protein
MIEGLLHILNAQFLLYMFAGVLVGITVGALPGFTATMATALVLPFTFGLDPVIGISMLGALYVAAMYSDAVPACLVNTPGTPSAMTTAFDGYPLTQRGEGQKALVGAAFGSLVGAVVGGLLFLFLSGPLASAALRFGPPEFFWIGVFAITIIGSIAGDSLLKGAAGGAIGLLISTMGLSTTGGVTRYTFGVVGLRGGVALVAALIGIFALPQLLELVSRRRIKERAHEVTSRRGVTMETIREILRRPGNVARSSAIGGLVGILPGAGGPMAALVSYNEAIRWSKDRKEFGKGSIHGVVASEAANSGAAGGSMIPMMALGIPGSGPAAIILGALLLQGLNPGPRMLITSPNLVYGFAWSVVIAGFVTFAVASVIAKPMTRMVAVPVRFLIPVILVMCVIGSYAIRVNMADVYVMVIVGVILYFLAQIGFHPGPVGLGFILGPIVEPKLVQSLALVRARSVAEVFFLRPLSMVLIGLTVASIVWIAWSRTGERSIFRAPDAGDDAAEDAPRWSVREAVLCGIVCLGIGIVYFNFSGRGAADWAFPILLTIVLMVFGVLFLVLAATGRGGRRVDLVPPIVRGHGVDVAVAVGVMAAYAVATPIVGFWPLTAIVAAVLAIYLDNSPTVRSTVKSVVFALVTTGVLFYFMRYVFYVPFPRSQLF